VRDRHKRMVGFTESAMPADGIPAAIRLERRCRHVPSRKADQKKTTGAHAYPKDLHIGQDVAQTIRSKPRFDVRVGSIATKLTGPACHLMSASAQKRPRRYAQAKRREGPTADTRDTIASGLGASEIPSFQAFSHRRYPQLPSGELALCFDGCHNCAMDI